MKLTARLSALAVRKMRLRAISDFFKFTLGREVKPKYLGGFERWVYVGDFTLSCVFHPVWCKIESRDQVTKSKAEILVINRELLCGCPAITPPLFPLLLPSS